MLEIEVKARVESLEPLRQLLEREGVMCETQTQKDTIFVRDASSVEKFYQNEIFIRIREVPGQEAVLTLKKKQKDLASLEYETSIGSVGETGKLLEVLGFAEALVINKKRIQVEYQGYTLCLDEVEGLGCFIEVEKLVEEGDPESIQQELWDWLETLDLSDLKRVTDAYDTLLLRKKLAL